MLRLCVIQCYRLLGCMDMQYGYSMGLQYIWVCNIWVCTVYGWLGCVRGCVDACIYILSGAYIYTRVLLGCAFINITPHPRPRTPAGNRESAQPPQASRALALSWALIVVLKGWMMATERPARARVQLNKSSAACSTSNRHIRYAHPICTSDEVGSGKRGLYSAILEVSELQ